MSKNFDDLGDGAQQRLWHRDWLAEAFRVLKPNGVIKAFGGTRTMHHLAMAVETAGFEKIGFEAWAYGCLSTDSEILTESGWKNGTEVVVGERVACWDSTSGGVTLQAVQETFRGPFKGDLVSLKNDNTDQLLTPNHRVYHQDDAGVWVVSEAVTFEVGSLVTLPIRVDEETRRTFAQVGRVPYDGEVWCVRVPTGAFVARHNGQVFITGNSGFPKSLNIAKKIDQMAYRRRETLLREALQEKGFEDVVWSNDRV